VTPQLYLQLRLHFNWDQDRPPYSLAVEGWEDSRVCLCLLVVGLVKVSLEEVGVVEGE
jgi:hypothetical protein